MSSVIYLLWILLDITVFSSSFGFRLSAFYLTLLTVYLLSFSLFYKKGYHLAFTAKSFNGFRAVYYRLTCFTNLLKVNRLFTLPIYYLFNFQVALCLAVTLTNLYLLIESTSFSIKLFQALNFRLILFKRLQNLVNFVFNSVPLLTFRSLCPLLWLYYNTHFA